MLCPIPILLTPRRFSDRHTRWFTRRRWVQRTTLGIVTLSSVLACDNSTQPTAPAVAAAPATPALAGGFTSRSLGTLGGLFSASFGINERTEVVGDATLPSEDCAGVSLA